MAKPTREDRVAYLRALCRTIPYTVVEPVLADPTEFSVRSRSFEGVLLHADLVGFTTLCDALARGGSDGLLRLTSALDTLFARLLEDALFPYEGYVLHFGGDSVAVLFRGEECAARAAAAALWAQRLMSQELQGLLGEEGRDLRLRIGLSQGEIHLPVVGDLTQRSAVCAGHAAHRAVALQERADPGSVLADAALVEALGDRAVARPHGEGAAVLLELRRPPARVPIRELQGRVETDTEAKIALLEPFVAPPLAARLRSTPDGWRIAGELREVVVAFVELAGLSEREQGPEFVLEVSRAALRAFRKYGGVVAKTDLCRTGHRLMVLFGLHLPSANDVERALLASLEACARLRTWAASRPELRLRIGVQAGPVYYGAFGSDFRHDITVVGDAVNTAARVVEVAEPFEVVVTGEVAARAPSFLVTDKHAPGSPGAPVRLRGRPGTVALKVVHGAREERAHYLRLRRQTRFLAGRSAEAALIGQVVAEARSGQARVLGLTGGEGTGKSAILANLVDEWVRRGGTGLMGRCRYATRSEPLAPIVSMFSAALGVAGGGGDGDDPGRRQRLREGLARLGEGAAELVELLQPLRRPDGASQALVDLADPQARERALAAVLGYLEQRSGGPMLYVVEDLHLADGLTLELAARVAQLPRDRAVLLVATYRPEPGVAGFRRILDHELSLEPLAPRQCEELLAHELGATAVNPELLAFLLKRTGGNPGHLVETARFLRERSLLPVRAGLATVPEGGVALLDDVVPASAATVALARLDGLGEVERRLLRTASAFGHPFGAEDLARVAADEVEPEQVGWAVENLEDLRLLSPEAGRWSFRDEVTRAVAYGTLPEPRRREVHRRIADVLEARPDLDPARDAAALGLHRERAGQAPEAAAWYLRAAETAFQAGLDEEVQYLAERWARLARELPLLPVGTAARMGLMRLVAAGRQRRHGEALRRARELLAQHGAELGAAEQQLADCCLGAALVGLGQGEKGRARLAAVYQEAQDPRLRCEAALELARSLRLGWFGAAAAEWVDRAEALSGKDPLLQARVDLARAEGFLVQGELTAAREDFHAMAEDARRHGRVALRARALAGEARCLLHARSFAQARRGFEQVLLLDRSLGLWADLAADLVDQGQTLLWDGQAQEARPLLEQALRYAQDQTDSVLAAAATVHLGAAVALSRDLAEGMALCITGARLAAQVGAREAQLAANLHLLRLALLRGDPPAAAGLLGRCAEDARDHRTPLFKAVAQELELKAAGDE